MPADAFSICDLCDAHEDRLADGRLRVLAPVLVSFGRRAAFAGPVATVQVFEDNALVRAALEQPGAGRVLVVDGGGSFRRALLGGKLARLAADNGWAGVVLDGCVRDRAEIDACDLGVRARGVHPRKPGKLGHGTAGAAISVLGTPVRPGEWLYADADGILISSEPLP